MKNEKVIASIIFFIISGLFFVLTLDFPTGGQSHDVGAAFMPKVYAGFLFLFSLILLIQGIKENIKKDESEPMYQNIALVVGIMLLTIVYVLLIPYLGFYLVSVAFMILFLKLTKTTSLKIIFLVPVGANLFIFIFFQKMLHVPVPIGTLFT